MTNFFFERYRPEIFRGLHKWCCKRIIRRFGSFRAKKIFFKNLKFFAFLAYPGSQISWKMTNFFFERYGPENFRGLHKWCCERILRRFRSFRAKKIFSKIASFLTFFAYPGHRFLEKLPTSFFERYRPEICRGLHKWCCERILRCFRLFRAKQIFFKNLKFFDFFCISGVTDFLKNDQLLFWEIRAWNFSWTAQMVLRTNFKAFKVVSSEKFFFQKLEIFWLFLHIQGHRFLEKWLTTFLRNTGLKFVVDCTNGVAKNFKAFKVVSSEKNFFQKLEIFLLFLHIQGHRFLEKRLTTFLRNTGLKFVVDCTNGVANKF